MVRSVLLIHWVRYTTGFQEVELYQFTLPGDIFCYTYILPPFLYYWAMKEYSIGNLDLPSSSLLTEVVFVTFLGRRVHGLLEYHASSLHTLKLLLVVVQT